MSHGNTLCIRVTVTTVDVSVSDVSFAAVSIYPSVTLVDFSAVSTHHSVTVLTHASFKAILRLGNASVVYTFLPL